MEEGSVTVDGVTREVPKPFIVMATQNPKGSAGTQPLPESQLDRFMLCMSMGYPAEADEIAIAKGKSVRDGSGQQQQLLDIDGLLQMQRQAEAVYVQDTVYRYIVRLVSATRENGNIELGVSPRGTIAITKMAKAQAYLQGRDYVLPADVKEVFADVTRHRIVLGSKARMARQTAENVMTEIIRTVPAPSIQKEKREYHA